MKKKTYLIGVDEAGRGAWAGPVVAGAFCVPIDFDFSLLSGLTDSKKLSHEKRETLFRTIEHLALEEKCSFSFSESAVAIIDQLGIREANRLAMKAALEQILKNTEKMGDYTILIDGRDNYLFEGIPREKVLTSFGVMGQNQLFLRLLSWQKSSVIEKCVIFPSILQSMGLHCIRATERRNITTHFYTMAYIRFIASLMLRGKPGFQRKHS